MTNKIEILQLRLKVALGWLDIIDLSTSLKKKCDTTQRDYYNEQRRKAIRAFAETITSLMDDCLPEKGRL